MNRPGWTVGPPSRLMLLVSQAEPAYANPRKARRRVGAGAHPPLAPFPGGTATSVSAGVRIGGVEVVDDARLAGRCPLEPLAGLAFGHPAAGIRAQSVFRAIHRDYGVPVAIRHPRPIDYFTRLLVRRAGCLTLEIASSAPTLDTVKSPNPSCWMTDSSGGPGSCFPNMAGPPCCRRLRARR
jgi:hypothetical protein